MTFNLADDPDNFDFVKASYQYNFKNKIKLNHKKVELNSLNLLFMVNTQAR